MRDRPSEPRAPLTPAERRARAAADPRRPRYHLTAPSGWLNDPNGAIEHGGFYHLFYQHNPFEPEWGRIHWGHARSRDLVHWEDLPIALAPGREQGEEHCFSGCAVVSDEGVPTIFYTSIGPGRPARDGAVQCRATGSSDLLHWQQDRAHPVLTGAGHGDLRPTEWRDPFVWKQDGVWNMVLGAGLAGGRGAVLLYRSRELVSWEFVGILHAGEPGSGERSWECPSFFPLGSAWVLLVSRYRDVRYFTGSFDVRAGRFRPERCGALDLGPHFYAPNGLRDARGRRIVWGWIRGAEGEDWKGALSLPRVLGLRADGRLALAPAPELAALRSRPRRHGRGPLPAGRARVLETGLTASAELCATLLPERADGVALRFGNARGGFELRWERAAGRLAAGAVEGAFALEPAESELRWHVFLDRSVVEVYANGRACLTALLPPELASGPLRLEARALGRPAWLDSLELWDLAGCWG